MLAKRIFACAEGEVGLPSVVVHELYFGVFKSAKVAYNLEWLRLFLRNFTIAAFEGPDARASGEIRAALAAVGAPIGPYDTLIAGQALARKSTLITNNLREFARVPGLAAEDWTI